ncbi:MAG: S8 family peptidase [Novosphingobium sp.]
MVQVPVIDAQVVNRLIFGYHDRQRFTQDTPVLPEVWQKFAADPSARQDVLITPFQEKPALALLRELLGRDASGELRQNAKFAPLQSFLAAQLTFDELVRHLLPLTKWTVDALANFETHPVANFPEVAFDEAYFSALEPEGRAAKLSESGKDAARTVLRGTRLDVARVVTLIAVIDLAQEKIIGGEGGIAGVEQLWEERKAIVARIAILVEQLKQLKPSGQWVWRIASNRSIRLSDEYSRSTVKADAAFRVFDVKCEKITWAVIDSGIDSNHPGFRQIQADGTARSRVERTYDLAPLRGLLDPAYDPALGGSVTDNPCFKTVRRQAKLPSKEAQRHLVNIYQSYQTDMLDWSSIEPLLKVAEPQVPTDGHGTHVAGIIGADMRDPDDPDKVVVRGMCPDIRLIDIRIISDTIDDTEFAVIAALQLVRYLNSHNQYIVVHGVNMSLSIPQVVESYGCGHTPLCNEAERLVGSGVCVVAAAGNNGYQKFQTERGTFPGYAICSITDPGNADAVITVGATHKRDPHNYGVSYFSSRGPTGDGRMKPDLVAPGERIESTLPDGETGMLDGTSQAAPHVSGAAAILMARYPELNRQPQRIKQILCETATDLGRERAFQGHGLLDVLRALQSF